VGSLPIGRVIILSHPIRVWGLKRNGCVKSSKYEKVTSHTDVGIETTPAALMRDLNLRHIP